MRRTTWILFFESLKKHKTFWAKDKQLSDHYLGELENRLLTKQIHQVHRLEISKTDYGLVLLGRKKRGVYNLEDLDIISRIIQQTRLTLNVLQLLEREKLLVAKNYEANLTALRSQINPHFLFNTLNTISSLIHDAPDDAEEAVEKLAFIFRYTLKKSSENFVSFKDELSLVTTYLDIEKMRFGSRLNLIYEIDQNIMERKLPALMIQTIVENSIKHGIARILDNGFVAIRIWEEDGFTVSEIEDNGPGIDVSKVNTSTGLTNTMTRLEQIYQMKNLLYFENTGNGTKVTLKIPIEHHEHL